MKDIVSKLTFGFIMAQLLPGIVVHSSWCCLAHPVEEGNIPRHADIFKNLPKEYLADTYSVIKFIIISLAMNPSVNSHTT